MHVLLRGSIYIGTGGPPESRQCMRCASVITLSGVSPRAAFMPRIETPLRVVVQSCTFYFSTNYSAPVGERSIAISLSVCLSVCLSTVDSPVLTASHQ